VRQPETAVPAPSEPTEGGMPSTLFGGLLGGDRTENH
jgi:hypothetical protein